MRTVFWVLGGLGVLAVGTVGAWWLYTRNIETPDYRVVSRDGAFEIRDYPALTVAEVVRGGDRSTAIRAGSARSRAISSRASVRGRRSR